ncbi:MAG: ABC transporter substrate-binding protein [Planctomycetota bacterium]
MKIAELSRRTAIGGLVASAGGLLLFGPRPSDDVPAGRVILDYWEKWTGAEGEAMRLLVDEFNRTQDTIYVRYLAINSIDQKAMIAIAGGSPPDVIGLWNFNVPSYAEAGALLPLDDLAASAGLSRERYADAVWPLLTHEGRLWSMISTCGSLALYLNLDVLESAGIDPASTPRTLDDLDEMNERIIERSSDGKLERMGFLHTEPGWWSWIWGYHFGGSLLDSTGAPTADAPKNVAAYEWVRSYPERFGSRELLAFQSGLGFYGTAQYPFLTGKVASVVQGPWMANLINAFAPSLRYRAVPIPVDVGELDAAAPVGLIDGDVLVIPKGAKHPEASFEFITWLQERARLERLAAAHGKNTPLRETSTGFVENHSNGSIAVHNALASSPRAFVFPRTSVWPRYVSEFDAAFQGLWLGEQTPRAMLSGIQQTMVREIAKERGGRRRREQSAS